MTPGHQADADLVTLQRDTFGYFLREASPRHGLVPDNTKRHPRAPCSITAVGLALSAYTVAVQRGYLSREEAAARTFRTLEFFWNAPHGPEADATGYRGFYYHFLDMDSGRRVWNCELSTIDSTFLLAGALAAGAYFDRDTPVELQIRVVADQLYRRADWAWALNGGPTVSHGWRPETGFLSSRWEGYSEAILLYVLGLASPTSPLPETSYAAFTTTYEWKTLYGLDHLYAGPLFIHQLSHCWIDFRGLQDAYIAARGIDYFENSRRATYVQRSYAIANPHNFEGYGEHSWGVTASDGPGPASRQIDGKDREFFDYLARGIPDGPDDGTLAPWAVVASLPFAPEIVLPAIEHIDRYHPQMRSTYGFKCSFNPTFRADPNGPSWVSHGYYGLDQGPIVLMIENYLTGGFWATMRRCPYLVRGLQRAGFQGGWLGAR